MILHPIAASGGDGDRNPAVFTGRNIAFSGAICALML
jgi:hypothetical protein